MATQDRLHLINMSTEKSYYTMFNDFERKLRDRLMKAREGESRHPCRKEFQYSKKLYCWIPTTWYRGATKAYEAYELVSTSFSFQCGNLSLVKFQDPHFYGSVGAEEFYRACLRPPRPNANSDDKVSKRFSYTFCAFLTDDENTRLLNWTATIIRDAIACKMEWELKLINLKREYEAQAREEYRPYSPLSPTDESMSESDDSDSDSSVMEVEGPPKEIVLVDLSNE